MDAIFGSFIVQLAVALSILGGTIGVVDIVGLQRGTPEATWAIDAAAAGRLGLSVAQISEQLSDAWLGDVQTELQLTDRTVPVRVRYPDAYRTDPAQMATLESRGRSEISPSR